MTGQPRLARSRQSVSESFEVEWAGHYEYPPVDEHPVDDLPDGVERRVINNS